MVTPQTGSDTVPESGEFVYEWERLARKGLIEDAIVEYVRRNDWVTFVELQNHLAAYMEVKGDHGLCLPNEPHALIWVNMSKRFVGIVQGLLVAKRLFLHPGSYLSYLIDGGLCTLPIVKRIPKAGLKKDHWLPACLRVVPLTEPRAKRKSKGEVQA